MQSSVCSSCFNLAECNFVSVFFLPQLCMPVRNRAICGYRSRYAAYRSRHQVLRRRRRGSVQKYGKQLQGRGSATAGFDFGFDLEEGLSPFITPPPPSAVRFPRKPLDMKLAVLLMRSSYESVDDLDFVPMDKFQVQFWKLRQNEVEPYTLQYSPLRISYGDLTDPLYFDFISFAQYAAISNAMQKGELVFQEKLGVNGEVNTVRRDTRLKDNSLLPAAFRERVSDRIYRRLLDGFDGQPFNPPTPCTPDTPFSQVVEAVAELVQVLVLHGYCLKAVITDVQPSLTTSGGRFKVRVEGPATLWGIQALASRRALISTEFGAMSIAGFLQGSQRLATYKTRFTDTFVEQLWTIA